MPSAAMSAPPGPRAGQMRRQAGTLRSQPRPTALGPNCRQWSLSVGDRVGDGDGPARGRRRRHLDHQPDVKPPNSHVAANAAGGVARGDRAGGVALDLVAAALPQVALDRGEPAGQPLGAGERVPDVVDVAAIAVLDRDGGDVLAVAGVVGDGVLGDLCSAHASIIAVVTYISQDAISSGLMRDPRSPGRCGNRQDDDGRRPQGVGGRRRGRTGSARQRSTSPRMKASTLARAVSSSYCSGGDFMK